MPTNPPIEIIRSPNRTRTATAHMADGKIEVRVPAHLSLEEEKELVDKLVSRLLKKEGRRTGSEGKLPNLKRRAADLNEKYFGGRLQVREIKWVSNQEKRYGSCTPSTATIRISDRVASLPLWVLDYVLVHELSHLVEANHSARFWKLVAKYPLAERARGYLMAIGLEGDAGPDDDDVADL